MNATRILKEARPLFWPWCAVALAGALPLVYPLDWIALIYLIGFFAVPLLATLSLGERIPAPNVFPAAFSTRWADGNLGREVERYRGCGRVGGSGFLPGLAGDIILSGRQELALARRGSSPSPLRPRFGRFSQDRRWAVLP